MADKKKRFTITIMLIALCGSILIPLISIWLPQAKEYYDTTGFSVIAIMTYQLLRKEKPNEFLKEEQQNDK